MRVLICGVRGSTPAPGPEFVRYGGNTSCVALCHDGEPPTLVLDAGTGLVVAGPNPVAKFHSSTLVKVPPPVASPSPSPPAPRHTFPPPLSPDTEPARTLPQAPVGHRQPRVGDVPKEGDVTRNESDVELDRKLSICRGC